jgi:hypothetical protein
MAENDTSTDASAIAAKAAVDKVVADKAAAVPTYDDKQTAHINKIVNEAYGKAFEKASGILSPQIKALQDQIAALAPKPDAAAVAAAKATADAAAAAAANGGDKSHEEVARLNARLIELQGIAEENKRRSSSSANRFASFSRESTRLPNRAG